MNKQTLAIILGTAAIAAAPQAFAQEAAPVEQAAPTSSFSEAELQAYAGVAAKLNQIQAEAGLSETDKQAQMASAVQSSGLDIAKFNAITEASKTDTALREKLQAAAK